MPANNAWRNEEQNTRRILVEGQFLQRCVPDYESGFQWNVCLCFVIGFSRKLVSLSQPIRNHTKPIKT